MKKRKRVSVAEMMGWAGKSLSGKLEPDTTAPCGSF